MIRLLSDHDVLHQARLIWEVFALRQWQAFGIDNLLFFPDVGLDRSASDREVWNCCQRDGLLLVTGNRNADDSDSLQTVIDEANTPSALPVLTIGRPQHVVEFSYRENCAYRVAEIALGLALLRGCGRIFIP